MTDPVAHLDHDPAEARHGATILRAGVHLGRWYWWRCQCGARSGPPYSATAGVASQAWAEHVAEAERP